MTHKILSIMSRGHLLSLNRRAPKQMYKLIPVVSCVIVSSNITTNSHRTNNRPGFKCQLSLSRRRIKSCDKSFPKYFSSLVCDCVVVLPLDGARGAFSYSPIEKSSVAHLRSERPGSGDQEISGFIFYSSRFVVISKQPEIITLMSPIFHKNLPC